jgi:WXG100 family type VII secretion target
MPLIQVNFPSLESAAADLNALFGRLTTQISDLEAAMRPVLASWDGAARDQYSVRHNEWTSATNELGDVISAFGKAVQESKQLHEATEAANVASLS